MMALSTGLSVLTATIAIAAVPSIAQAEAIVPPGNSAATQYTEAIPTAGGPKATGKSRHPHGSSPTRVLGARNAAKLDAQGSEGREVAAVVAETAPSVDIATSPQGKAHEGRLPPKSDGGASNAAESPAHNANRATNGAGSRSLADEPGGSSGLGEVIGQATGSSSSGQMGVLLPLLIVAAIAWSLAYLWHQRKRPTA